MSHVIPLWPRPELPIAGSGSAAFPIRRVFCVGRNYAEHAREMGHSGREPPFFFGKSPEALTLAGEVAYPPATRDLHHEVELVVALGKGGRDIPAQQARDHIIAYAVGIDLTRRDLQAEAKKLARPWYLSKSFVGAAPIGPLHLAATVGHPRKGAIWLEVDGQTRQKGDLGEMIWSVEEIVAHLSGMDELLAGDLVFTGTPAGVGQVGPGSRMRAGIDGLGLIDVTLTG
jgi:fumarylpyruvate hydrolase